MSDIEFINEQYPSDNYIIGPKNSTNYLVEKKSEKDESKERADKNYKITEALHDEVRESNIHVVSFFSGAGGLDIGAQLAKAKVISSHDFDADSIKTLRSNAFFNHAQHNLGDISQAQGLDFKPIIEKNNPDKLIIVGGPPCQPFSKQAIGQL